MALPAPCLSVIIPIHNAHSTLPCLIESLKEQRFADFEAICVDDGSTDDSPELCSRLIADDSRFSLIKKHQGGVSSARNLGLENARGTWIFFADSDDWLAPYALDVLVAAAEPSAADMAIADFYRVRDGHYSVKGVGTSGLLSFGEFMDQMVQAPANFYYGSLWNKLFRRSIITANALRFDESLSFGEDHVFILGYLEHVEHIAVCCKPVYYYYDSPGSLMHRSLNPLGVAKNKNEVMAAYERLCAKAGITDTLMGEAIVMSFLISPATDGMVMPFDEKLGIGQVPASAVHSDERFKGLFKPA